MGLQPLKPCLATLTTNEWSRHSARPPDPCLLTLTANEWSRRLARPHVHNLATLTAPAKHLYHTYSTNKKHLPYIIPTLTLFTALVPVFTLFPLGQSPTKPGGWGATPTLKTHGVLFYTGPRPNQAKPSQTKPNQTKRNETASSKNQRFETKTRFFGFVFFSWACSP